MSHEMTFTNGKAMMAYNKRNGVPWWDHAAVLAEALEGTVTGERMLTAAKMDWLVEHGPVFDHEGKPVAGYKTNFRRDPERGIVHLGIVHNTWTAFQNYQKFELLDKIVGAGHAVYETAGVLFDGKRTFASLDTRAIPGMVIDLPNGEQLPTWLVALNGHDGFHKLAIYMTTIRPVCWNTVSSGLASARTLIQARHTPNITDKAVEMREELGLKFDNLRVLSEECKRLVETPADFSIVDTWLRKIFPDRKDAKPDVIRREKAEVAYLAQHGTGNDGKTLWDYYNGFTQWLDDRTPRVRKSATEQYARDTKLVSVIAGSDSQRREEGRKVLVALARSQSN